MATLSAIRMTIAVLLLSASIQGQDDNPQVVVGEFVPQGITESDASILETATNQADVSEKELTTPASVSTTTAPAKGACQFNLTGPSGFVTSKNFPEEYEPMSNCTWNITVPEGQRIKLTFHLFNTESHGQCIWDWLKVYDSNGTLLKYICGYLSQDLVIKSSSNTMSMHFFSDSVIQGRGFLASWTTLSAEEQEKPEDKGPAKSYSLSFPQSFYVGSPEQVCLQLNNVNADGEVNVALLSSKSLISGEPSAQVNIAHTSGNEEIQCVNLTLPAPHNESFAVLRIKAEFKSINYHILSYKSVKAVEKHPMLLIQTDKGDYRPNQEVKVRLLLLNPDLKPDASNIINEVWIHDPSDARVAQWKNVSTTKGLAQVAMPLSIEPELGTWNVKVDFGQKEPVSASFIVSESVLPKFEVSVTGPKSIIKDSDEETFRVCALYTHGNPVQGSANVTITSSYSEGTWWRAPLVVKKVERLIASLEKGCANITLNQTDIALLSEKSKDLNIDVIVTEQITGVKQNTTFKTVAENTAFKFDFAGSSTEHIIGGFPFVGVVKAVGHDGNPLSSIRFEVCLKLFTDVNAMRDYINSQNHLFYSFDEDQMYDLSQKVAKILMTKTCYEHTTKEDGSFKFAVPLDAESVWRNVTKLRVSVAALDKVDNTTTGIVRPKANLDVSLTHTNLSQAITIHSLQEKKLACGPNSLDVFLSAKPDEKLDLTYFITSGAAIVGTGRESIQIGTDSVIAEFVGEANTLIIDYPNASGQKSSSILVKKSIAINRPFGDVENRVTGKIKVLATIRNNEGHTLSASKELPVESCDPKVSLKLSSNKVYPGSDVSLLIESIPGSRCGYSIVDKSVDLVGNENKMTRPRIEKLKDDLASKRVLNDEVSNSCKDANLLYKAFESIGLYVLSDRLIEKSECDSLIDATNLDEKEIFEPIPVPVAAFSLGGAAPAAMEFQAVVADDFSGTRVAAQKTTTVDNRFAVLSAEEQVNKPQVELRNYFPETWLFDIDDLNEEGRLKLDISAPHTITTWVSDAFCTNVEHGVLLADTKELLVSQDFFADLFLPFSVKRGESFPLNISVFNSLSDQKLPMRLTLKESDAFRSDQYSVNLCLDPKSNQIKSFHVTPKDLHEVNFTVEAVIASSASEGCGSVGSAEGFKDALQKPVQVKPEGYPVEKVQSEFICLESGQSSEPITMNNLRLPADLVEGSARAWITVSGDVMAPALSNLDNLVTMPTGCGEQNMITMVPNIFLLEYLKSTSQSQPKLEEQAKKYIKLGYERQNEKYRHSDGSYSIWGPRDPENKGSMWLTSFVIKSFSQASKYISVDTHNMQQSINWMLERQSRKSGCFEVTGQLIHSSLGGPERSLTASTVIMLLEVINSNLDVLVDPAVLKEAMRCLEQNPAKETEVYTRSLVSYALSYHQELSSKGKIKNQNTEDQLKFTSLAVDALNSMLAQGNTSQPGKLFWVSEDGSLSRSVEITAYNTLTLILHDKLPEALKAIKWMSQHRNSRGGFISTQDTMMAIQALAKYSIKINRVPNQLRVKSTFGAAKEEYSFSLTEDNKLLQQREKLESLSPTEENSLTVSIEGQGCLMVQSILRYNLKESPEKTSFTLSAKQSNNQVTICASYTGPKESTDMTLIEAELLSGFEAYEQSLEVLLNELSGPILKKYEIDTKANKVILYFDGLTKENHCWKIDVKRQIMVEGLKPAIVKIYDYYNTQDVFSTEYSLTE